MEADDDMIVVIIGDEDELETKQTFHIKEEPSDKIDECMTIEEFVETVEKHGEKIDLDPLQSYVKEERWQCKEEEFVDEEFLEDDEEAVFLRKRQKFYEDNSNQRHSMRKPSERQSFVNELKQENPQYETKPDHLIEHLVRIMKSITAPDPPNGYCYYNKDALFVCYKCDTVSDTLPAAGRHYQEKHGPRYLICFACGVDFRSTTNLYKHEKCCAAPDAVYVLKARARCLGMKGRSRPYLPSKAEIKNIRKRFDMKNRSQQSYQCFECPATFQCATALQAHNYLHLGLRPYKCKICSAAYTSKSALLRHESTKHKDNNFNCDHCGRSFKVKAALVAHMDTHKPEKKHGCEKCGKRYSQRAALLLHVRKQHLQLPPPFACQVCDKRFARMYILKIHMKEKHGLSIMTRKMFFKTLPTMTDAQVVEKAKLIFKSDDKTEDLTKEFFESIKNGNFQEVDSIEEGEYVTEDSDQKSYEDGHEYDESQDVDGNQTNNVYYEDGEIPYENEFTGDVNDEYEIKYTEEHEEPENNYEVVIENVYNEEGENLENQNESTGQEIECQEVNVERVLRETQGTRPVNKRQVMIKINGGRLKSKKIQLIKK